MSFEGAVVLVTGGAGGLGAATVRQLHGAGAAHQAGAAAELHHRQALLSRDVQNSRETLDVRRLRGYRSFQDRSGYVEPPGTHRQRRLALVRREVARLGARRHGKRQRQKKGQRAPNHV